ncbi:GMC oxidoreductase-domain-containing protein [Mrakia frigida]|uniref:GMC family oxidoreductase n=1 Tax=Mrakia frigida TaxID=29902 RepID=UPI003FCC0504
MLSLLPIALIASLLQLPQAEAAYGGNPYRQMAHRSIVSSPTTVDGQSFDFVIAGGGVAGLALAARLSEWSNTTVCVIEAGGDGSDVQDQIDIAGYSYLNSLTNTPYDWQYKTTAQVDTNGTVVKWPRGKGLGGSGAINGLFWTKPSEAEYDAWATLNPDGEETWNWSEMDKYTQKAETYNAPTAEHISSFGIIADASAHGSSGPIQSGYPAYLYSVMENWIPTWTALGFTARDLHGGNTHGVNISPSTIRTSNQTRSDSKAGYITPLPPRSNLVILTGYQVTKVNFNSTTSGAAVAGGVSFSASKGSTVYSVTANKEVILSGGVVGSPQILQLSGVGPADLMTQYDIDSVVDLPVGYNLQDHFSTSISFSVPTGTVVWGELLNTTNAASALAEYTAGDYADSEWTYVNGGIGYPSLADITTDYATYASTATSALASNVKLMTGYQTLPDNVASGLSDQYELQNSWLSTDVGQLEVIFNALSGTSNVAIQIALQHPYSRGTIMINTTDAFSAPVINPGYLGLGYDVDIINKGIVFARKIAATAPMSALTLVEQAPSAGLVDTALNTWIGTSGSTEYHPLGTCSMLPQAKGGVVSTKLIVYGTTNLRVVDASIIPLHLSSHVMSPSYAIGEKAADLIKADMLSAGASSSSSSSASGTATTTTGKTASSSAAAATAIAGSSNGAVVTTGMSATTKSAVIGGAVGGVGAIALGLVSFSSLSFFDASFFFPRG